MKLPVALVALGALLLPTQAEARDCVWRQTEGICRDTFTGARYYCTRNTCVYPRTYYRTPYRDRYNHSDDRRYYNRDREVGRTASTRRVPERCLWEARLRVTGTDKLEKSRAEVSAQDAWSSTVETRHGTLFSDIQNAADLIVTCVRKVPSSIVERAQAAGGLRHFVCEISAVPCPPEAEEQDDDSRAKRRMERRSESPVSDQPARP